MEDGSNWSEQPSSSGWGQVRATLLGSLAYQRQESARLLLGMIGVTIIWNRFNIRWEDLIMCMDRVWSMKLTIILWVRVEYGSAWLRITDPRKPLLIADEPVGSLKDIWRLLPYFLQPRSMLRQHLNSFDHFVDVAKKEIVSSPSACKIRSDHDPKFYLRYEVC